MLFPKFQKGTPARAADLNAVVDLIKRVRVLPSSGIRVTETTQGTSLALVPSRVGGGGVGPAAWDILQVSTTGEPGSLEYTVRVQPGTAAGILASNWEDEFTCAEDDLCYGVLEVTTDGQFITGTTINVTNTLPTIQTPQKFGIQSSINIVFGMFKNGTNYNFTGGVDLPLQAEIVLAVSADPAAQPGQSPFDLYYRLQ